MSKHSLKKEKFHNSGMIIISNYIMKFPIERFDTKWLKFYHHFYLYFLNLKEELQLLETAKVDGLHFDVMDGKFVPNISIGIPILDAVRQQSHLPIDVHLMIEQPENYINLLPNMVLI